MTFIRKLVSALCLAGCFSASLSNAQTVGVVPAPGDIATTGNLVNSTPTATTTTTTWQNVGSWNQGLPCWAPEDGYNGAYCGPQPYFNQGAFNFSYGITDVNQTANIAAALPNSGTGLRVTGYNFGFMAKNGNGWDGGGLDTLWAYVRLDGRDGKALETDYYNLNYQFDWTQFNFGRNYTTPYATRDLDSVTYGFIAGDTSNGWAGPYGPEIYNISFNLRYDVDPCSYNPLYSPSCPGFTEAMAKLTEQPVLEPTANETVSVSPGTAVTTVSEPAPTSAPVSTATAQSSSTAAPAVTATAAAPTAPATTAAPARSVAPLSTSAVLANIRSLEQQIQTTVNNTVQTSISTSIEAGAASAQQAQQEATQSQLASQQQADAAAQASSAQSSTTTATNSGSNNTNTVSASIGLGTGISAMAQGQGITVTGNESGTASSQALSAAGSVLTPVITASIATVNRIQDTAAITNDAATQDSPLAGFVRPGDPTQAARTGALVMPPPEPPATTGSSVRNTAPPTELAGGADFAAMTRAADITSYTSQRLADAAFYQPREIYRGQRVVDNVWILRGLGTDRLHQEMVDQQYRK